MVASKLYLEASNVLTINNSNEKAYIASSNDVVIDASKRSKAINITGNTNANEIIGGKSSDTLSGGSGNDTLTGGAGKDVFIYSGGNDLITDYSAGQDTIKIINDTINSVNLNEDEGYFTFSFANGGTLQVQGAVKKGKPQKITITDSNDVTSSQIYGVESITIADSDGSIINTEINTSVETISAASRNKAVWIIGNDYENLIKGGKGNDTLNGGAFSSDTLIGGKKADVFIYGGGEDVITDYDPEQGDVIRLEDVSFNNYNFFDDDLIFETSGGNLTIVNGKAKPITWISETGKETTKTYKASDEIVFYKNDTITSFNASKIEYLNTFAIDASRLTKAITIEGNSKDNIIKGGSGNDSIYGASGDDTLTSGKGKDTIVHDKGNDVIEDYEAGKDVIKIKSPHTSLTGASISSDEETDIVLTFSNKSTVTVKNAIKISSKGKKTYKKLTIADGNGKATSKTYAVDSIKLTSKDAPSFNASSPLNVELVTINASGYKKPIYITGNNKGNIITGGSKDDTIIAGANASTLNGGSGNDQIRGSRQSDSIIGGKDDDKLYGNAGNDTINGGAGNDTIYGGTGNDVFIYKSGDGLDIIEDYSAGDIIKLGSSSTKIKSASSSGKDYVLTIGSGNKNKITFKNIGNTAIKVVDYKGNETIYNNGGTEKSYTSRSYINLEEEETPWFTADDLNVVGANSDVLTNNNLSSILRVNADIITSESWNTASILTNTSNSEGIQVVSVEKEK